MHSVRVHFAVNVSTRKDRWNKTCSRMVHNCVFSYACQSACSKARLTWELLVLLTPRIINILSSFCRCFSPSFTPLLLFFYLIFVIILLFAEAILDPEVRSSGRLKLTSRISLATGVFYICYSCRCYYNTYYHYFVLILTYFIQLAALPILTAPYSARQLNA
jgi:hypothetical protein